MKKLVPFAVLALAMLGCSPPSPEKLCKHIWSVEEKDKEISEKKLSQCVKKVEELKSEKPDLYKCLSPCMMDAKDRSDVKACEKKCREKEADKKKDDDDDKKSKKKKGDDDDK